MQTKNKVLFYTHQFDIREIIWDIHQMLVRMMLIQLVEEIQIVEHQSGEYFGKTE